MHGQKVSRKDLQDEDEDTLSNNINTNDYFTMNRLEQLLSFSIETPEEIEPTGNSDTIKPKKKKKREREVDEDINYVKPDSTDTTETKKKKKKDNAEDNDKNDNDGTENQKKSKTDSKPHEVNTEISPMEFRLFFSKLAKVQLKQDTSDEKNRIAKHNLDAITETLEFSEEAEQLLQSQFESIIYDPLNQTQFPQPCSTRKLIHFIPAFTTHTPKKRYTSLSMYKNIKADDNKNKTSYFAIGTNYFSRKMGVYTVEKSKVLRNLKKRKVEGLYEVVKNLKGFISEPEMLKKRKKRKGNKSTGKKANKIKKERK
ncbi:hypothetical protein HK098_003714 [Nowakowskiella sp. JEL0407]|nr:hypothetical protein HK098_003714 [Nowakowskiella sp. JEL0407]